MAKKTIIFLYFLLVALNLDALSVKFAIIGDYGELGPSSKAVASLVKSWNPDFIITTGDNNYPVGSETTIDDNVGSLYSDYIFPYQGKYPHLSLKENRFFPCMGNHDFDTQKGRPYLKYFSLPGNGRYYDFVKGDIHFFALSSDPREPDGIDIESKQATWLKERLKESTSPWKVVYFHHPVYSSRNAFYTKNGERKIDFPFSNWGVSIVLNGHIHSYERFEMNGMPYIVNGLGGHKPYDFYEPEPESLVRYAGDYGAILAEVKEDIILFKFITISGKKIDEFFISRQ